MAACRAKAKAKLALKQQPPAGPPVAGAAAPATSLAGARRATPRLPRTRAAGGGRAAGAAAAAAGPAAGGNADGVPVECEAAAVVVVNVMNKALNRIGLGARHRIGVLRLILQAVRAAVGE